MRPVAGAMDSDKHAHCNHVQVHGRDAPVPVQQHENLDELSSGHEDDNEGIYLDQEADGRRRSERRCGLRRRCNLAGTWSVQLDRPIEGALIQVRLHHREWINHEQLELCVVFDKNDILCRVF